MLSNEAITKVSNFYHGKPLVLEGCNGSIGLSLLEVLRLFEVRPSALLLTTHNSNPNIQWFELSKNVVALKSTSSSFIFERDQAIREMGPGVNVLFCAGYGRPSKFVSDPASVIETNILNLLTYNRFDGLASFAFTSTSELYAGLSGTAMETSPLPTTPQHSRGVYIESKRLGEAIVENIFNKKIARCASFRVALATPPYMLSDDSRVLADLINKGLKQGIVTLNGGGHYVRQYQYGPNCAMKILGAMACGTSRLYNNSGSHIVTLGDLAELIAKILNLPYQIMATPVDSSAPEIVLIDNKKINMESHYDVSKELSFESYLRKMVNI
jgi:nucleoside-diphosphate-sugar epimerase